MTIGPSASRGTRTTMPTTNTPPAVVTVRVETKQGTQARETTTQSNGRIVNESISDRVKIVTVLYPDGYGWTSYYQRADPEHDWLHLLIVDFDDAMAPHAHPPRTPGLNRRPHGSS